MLQYEVDLTRTDNIDNFYSKIDSQPNAPDLYQQVLEYELEKLDLDPEQVRHDFQLLNWGFYMLQ